MKKKYTTILLACGGLILLAGVMVVAMGVFLFMSAVDSTTADEAAATRAFDEARAKFDGAAPVLDLVPSRPVLTRAVPEGAPARPVQRLHVLAWDPNDEGLARVTLPFWLLRMQGGAFEFVSGSGASGFRVTSGPGSGITVEQLERFGPALLVDHLARDGDRLLVWTE